MKHLNARIFTIVALTSAPLSAATIPAGLVGQTVALTYDFSAAITQLTDDAPFGLPAALEPPSPAKTPYFGLSNGDVVAGSLTLDLTFGDSFSTINSASCMFGGYNCLYGSFRGFALEDPITGAANFESTDFTSGTFLSFGTGKRSDVAAEWSGASGFVIRNIKFNILDYTVAGLPPVAAVPVPASLSLLGGSMLMLGAAGLARRHRRRK